MSLAVESGHGMDLSDVVTCPKQLRSMLVGALGFDDEAHNALSDDMCKIELHKGACYVPGKGFQGVRVSLALPHAHRIMDVYERYAQPPVGMVSVFSPGEKLSDAQYEGIRERALTSKQDVMRMTQKALIDKGSDVAQFFAHYGKLSDTRAMYKRSKDGKQSGAICIWSSPDMTPDDLIELRDTLSQISDINGGGAHDDAVSGDLCEDELNEEEMGGAVGGAKAVRSPDDDVLHRELVGQVSAKMQTLRAKADDFNRSYAFSVCNSLDIPVGSIIDGKWRKLYTTTACSISNLSVEGDRLVASMNENHCREGNAVVFHSPESGSTLYKLGPEAAASGLSVASSLGRHRTRHEAAEKDEAPVSREVMSHGIQIPPAIDGISSNRYATNEAAESYVEDMVHRGAWTNSNEAHHLSSEFYLSGAPHPVTKGGITDEAELRLFLDNLVFDEHHEATGKLVYVPDKNQVVCDIVRRAHPNTWLDVITSDSSVKDSTGTIVGWNIPLDKLRQI